MKFKDKNISDFQLCEGENISIIERNNELFISAPSINDTRLRHKEFVISGKEIEIESGRNVHITTTHPNKMIIGCDFDVEKATILRLEKRIENLERVIAKLLKEK